MVGFGSVLVCLIAFAWLKLTTPEKRAMIGGYLLALAVLMFFVALVTGQGPFYAYG